MKYYFNHLIKEHKANSKSIMFIGRFGEDLLFSRLPDGNYIFSSAALGLYDLIFSEEFKTKIINQYAIEGDTGFFDKTTNILSRALELGETMHALYKEYQGRNDKECLSLIKQILKDVERFKLNKEKYIDWFVTFGGDEDPEYINYVLSLRREIVET